MKNAAEVIADLQGFVDTLRAQADRYERAIALLQEEQATPKAKRGAREERRPTRAGAKAGKTRTRVAAYLAKHPAAALSEMATALQMKPPAVAYHLKALRA